MEATPASWDTREKSISIVVDVYIVLITDWQIFNLHCAQFNNELKCILTRIWWCLSPQRCSTLGPKFSTFWLLLVFKRVKHSGCANAHRWRGNEKHPQAQSELSSWCIHRRQRHQLWKTKDLSIRDTQEVETQRPKSHSRAVGGAKGAEVEWINCEESGTMSIQSVFGWGTF